MDETKPHSSAAKADITRARTRLMNPTMGFLSSVPQRTKLAF